MGVQLCPRVPLALHAPLPLPCCPQGARLGPWPFPLLLPLPWQLLAELQPETVLSPDPLIAVWLLICFSTGPRSPGKGMLHGPPAPEPCSMVGATMLRLELEGVCYSQAAPLLPGSSVLGQGYSLHIPERVRTSPCSTLPYLLCCVLGAGDPALLPCWGPAPLLGPCPWQPTSPPSNCCGGFQPRLHSRGVCASCPSPSWPTAPLGLAAPPADGQPSWTAAPARLGHSFLPKSSLPLPSWAHQCLPPAHTLPFGLH